MYSYVDPANPNLICCVCRLPFTDPTVTRTCAHTFCRDCILCAIDHSPQCPIDRSTLTQDDLAPANPIIRSLVDELAVECPHSAEGCIHTCQRQLLSAHLLNSCIYRQVPCPQGKCQETMCFKDTSSHHHDEDESSGVPNIQEAGKDQPLAISEASTSPKAVQSELGSSTPSTNRETNDVDRRAAALLEQNILFRHKIQILEGLVYNLQRDMATVKRVLGPWFQVGERATTAAGHISTSMPMYRPPLDPSTSHVDIHAPGIEVSLLDPPSRSQNRNSHFRGSVSPPADTLAPYFPPELEATSNSQSIHVSQTFPSRLDRSSSGIDFLGSPQLPQASLVAPLNLSTTLEGTLHGLRESVIGLAASVDSMGRRHEIALAHETARMAEEVGGLRAGIHGLRMQMHSIMMDRNSRMTGRDGVGEGDSTGQWMPLPAPLPQVQPRIHHPHQVSITKL